MRKLLLYYIKKRAFVVGVISAILILIGYMYYYRGFVYFMDYFGEYSARNNPADIITIAMCILVTIVPMFEFNFKMNKISVDEFYSFPIRREKLYLTKYIVGLFEIIVPILVFFGYSMIRVLSADHLFTMVYFIPYLFSVLGIGILIYTIVVFVYTRCNTYFDGIINVALLIFLFVPITSFLTNRDVAEMIGGTVENYLRNKFEIIYLYSPIVNIGGYFESLTTYEANLKVYSNLSVNFYSHYWIELILYFVLAIGSFIGIIYFAKKEKVEKSMGISDSWFSYKTLIPYYIITIFLGSESYDVVTLIIILIISGYIGYVIYRRNFKIKLCDLIVLVSCIPCSILIYGIFLCFL